MHLGRVPLCLAAVSYRLGGENHVFKRRSTVGRLSHAARKQWNAGGKQSRKSNLYLEIFEGATVSTVDSSLSIEHATATVDTAAGRPGLKIC